MRYIDYMCSAASFRVVLWLTITCGCAGCRPSARRATTVPPATAMTSATVSAPVAHVLVSLFDVDPVYSVRVEGESAVDSAVQSEDFVGFEAGEEMGQVSCDNLFRQWCRSGMITHVEANNAMWEHDRDNLGMLVECAQAPDSNTKSTRQRDKVGRLAIATIYAIGPSDRLNAAFASFLIRFDFRPRFHVVTLRRLPTRREGIWPFLLKTRRGVVVVTSARAFAVDAAGAARHSITPPDDRYFGGYLHGGYVFVVHRHPADGNTYDDFTTQVLDVDSLRVVSVAGRVFRRMGLAR